MKSLVGELRSVKSRSKGDLLERAATAIENLLAERNAMLDKLRRNGGECELCKHEKFDYNCCSEDVDCENCTADCACKACTDSSRFEWKGVQATTYTATRHDICLAALELWGAEKQTLKVFEEMGELQKELCKNGWGADNRDAIAEEIADVRNVLIQMCILHDCADLAEKYQEEKLARLLGKIEKAMKERAE